MYGLIGKVTTLPGQRAALVALLVEGTSGMPGCLSYVVAHDLEDEDALWITEVWNSEADHRTSLSLAPVQRAIQRGRPLIRNFEMQVRTVPVGGQGLTPHRTP